VPPGKTAQGHLEDLTWAGVQTYFDGNIDDKLRATLKKELALIAELKYAHYFLTVHDIVHYARSQNILCQGRGSAANSAVCYVLGITSVNPTNVDLLFERFISKERLEPPDIDVDFEHSRREGGDAICLSPVTAVTAPRSSPPSSIIARAAPSVTSARRSA